MTTFLSGRVFGHDLSKIVFVYDSIQPDGTRTSIENGEILILEEYNENYLLRVTNILFGQSQEWSLTVARGYNQHEKHQDLQHENPQERYRAPRGEQMFFTAECEMLGIIRGETFVSVRKPPSYFAKVRKLREDDLHGRLLDRLGDIDFGHLRSGSETLGLTAGLYHPLLAKHTGVFARTGGGKSNTMKVIVGRFLDEAGSVGALLFEPHGEYIYDLKRHPLASKQMVMYNQDGRGGDRKVRIAHSRITVESLMNVRKQMNWTEPQERFMLEVATRFGKKWFNTILETPVDHDDRGPGGLDDVMGDYEEMMSGSSVPATLRQQFSNTHVDTIKAVKSKIKRIATAPYLTDKDDQDDVSAIMRQLEDGKVVLIDMVSLSGLHELLLSSVLGGEVLKRRKQAYAKDRTAFESGSVPPIVIILEEAQRVLGKGDDVDSNIFTQIVNEGRKFGTGLIAITQQPKLMNEVILSQFNTLIILGISDEKDFDILKGTSQQPLARLRLEVTQLMPGEAIVTSPLAPFAIPLKVYHYDDYIARVKATTPNTLGSISRKTLEGF